VRQCFGNCSWARKYLSTRLRRLLDCFQFFLCTSPTVFCAPLQGVGAGWRPLWRWQSTSWLSAVGPLDGWLCLGAETL